MTDGVTGSEGIASQKGGGNRDAVNIAVALQQGGAGKRRRRRRAHLDAFRRVLLRRELRDVPVAPAAAVHELHALARVVGHGGAQRADAALEPVEDDGRVEERVRVRLRLEGEHAAAVGGGEQGEPADVRPDVHHERRPAAGVHARTPVGTAQDLMNDEAACGVDYPRVSAGV